MGEAKRKRRALLPPGDIMRTVTMVDWFHWQFTAAGIPIRISQPTEPCEGRTCWAGLIFTRLLEGWCLPRFRAAWRGIGNCHVATEAIRRDLEPLGDDNPFAFLCGSSALLVTDCDPEGFHCWLEHDGWAIDVANGNPIMIMPADDFYATFELTCIRRKAGTLTRPIARNEDSYAGAPPVSRGCDEDTRPGGGQRRGQR